MPLPNVTMPPGSTVSVTAAPLDASGNPATIFDVLAWTAENTSIVAAINTSNEGLFANVTAGSTPGTTQVAVTFQATNGGPTLTSSFTVTVSENPATQLGFTFGTPS